MGTNLVVCCDGTGNQVEGNLSNVLKLFRIAEKSVDQRVYYSPGVGTIGTDDPWTRLKQNAKAVFGLATGYGLHAEILGAYRFLCERFKEEDSIYLFGFSRGAYTVRALAGFIHMVGLLPPDQLNIAGSALTAYKRASEEDDLDIAWNFARIISSRRATIRFMGVWDTVASILVPRRDRLIPALQTLPYTRRNPSVEVFRHAMAIDERRRMYRLNRWIRAQPLVANRFDTTARPREQDIRQVWFVGVHADVGGGYPEAESALSKFPLAWMIGEAVARGLKINTAMRNHLVLGKSRAGSNAVYVTPDPKGDLHRSLTGAWWWLEWLPKSMKWNEWKRPHLFGYYLPLGEPRCIADPIAIPRVHQSVLDRKRDVSGYVPVNFPQEFEVEPLSPAP